MKKTGFFLIVAFFLISCQFSRKNYTVKNDREWIGQKINIPDGIVFKALGKDTLYSDIWDKPYKIFTYIDSAGCTSCQMHLPEWKAIIRLCHQQHIDVGFIFAVHSSNFKHFEEGILASYFDYPIIYDFHNRFEKMNHFPPVPNRTFLLDKENRILLVGSPINNSKVWELYKKQFVK